MPDHGSGEAGRAAAQVLAREEYADLRPGLLDLAWSAVLDGLGRLLDLLAATGQAGLIGSVAFVAVVAALVFAAARLLRRVRPSPGMTKPEVRLAGRSSAEWAAEGREHEASGRWREAARCHHRALVAELAAAGLVEELPGRTAAEYEAEAARSAPAAAPGLRNATSVFERAWYASVPIGSGDLSALHEAAAQVRRSAGLRQPAGLREAAGQR